MMGPGIGSRHVARPSSSAGADRLAPGDAPSSKGENGLQQNSAAARRRTEARRMEPHLKKCKASLFYEKPFVLFSI